MLFMVQMTVQTSAADDAKSLPFKRDSWKNYELGSGEFANGGLRLQGRSGLFVMREKIGSDISYEFNCKQTIEKGSSAGIIIGMQMEKGMPWDNYNSSYLFEFADMKISLIRFTGAEKTILQSKNLNSSQWLGESRIIAGSEKNGEALTVSIMINGDKIIRYVDKTSFAGNGGYFGFYSLDGAQIAILPVNGVEITSNNIKTSRIDWILYISIFMAVGSIVAFGLFEYRKRKRG